jgi:kynureninase
MGQRNLFDFELEYRPITGLRHFLSGTYPVVSLSLIESGVDLLLEAGMENLRVKSQRQSEYLINLWEEFLKPLGFALNSPRESERRGSHVSLGHSEGLRIDQALIHELNVLPDFRPPDTIRIGMAPIYTSYRDIHTAVMCLQKVVIDRLYEKYPGQAPVVT